MRARGASLRESQRHRRPPRSRQRPHRRPAHQYVLYPIPPPVSVAAPHHGLSRATPVIDRTTAITRVRVHSYARRVDEAALQPRVRLRLPHRAPSQLQERRHHPRWRTRSQLLLDPVGPSAFHSYPACNNELTIGLGAGDAQRQGARRKLRDQLPDVDQAPARGDRWCALLP